MLLLMARALANSGFAFEGTTVFRWGVATEGIAVFRSTMLPLIARTFANSGFVFEGTNYRFSVRYHYRGNCRLSKLDASAYCKEEA